MILGDTRVTENCTFTKRLYPMRTKSRITSFRRHAQPPTVDHFMMIKVPFGLPRGPPREGLAFLAPVLSLRTRLRANRITRDCSACASSPSARTLRDEIEQATRERRRFRIDKSALTQAEKRELRLRSKAIPLVADHDPLDVVFEDEAFLAVNKPPYVKMHPSHRFEGGSLLNRAIGYLGYPPRLLHRLDMHTTGIVIMAKSKQVCHPIMRQFMHGTVKKQYLCLVDGHLPQQPNTSFTVEAPIQRSHRCYVREVGDSNPDSKPAKTVYTIMDKSQSKQIMLLQATPHTGRTHQIRVHAASRSLPIIGDDLYNPKEHAMYADYDEINAAARDEMLAKYGDDNPLRKGLKLHAWSISLINPLTNERISFSAPPPSHMNSLIEWCGLSVPK